ncbi:MAG: sigma-54-dependent transcriptional regulator [Saprospiraceae bacterium]
MNKLTIFIADDDQTVCISLALLLRRAGFDQQSFNHPRHLLAALERERPSLILLDMNYTIDTSGRKGIATLKEIMAIDKTIPVILMTGWATVQLAVEGMKIGARDFIAKPWENKQLLNSIKTILALENISGRGKGSDTSKVSDPSSSGFDQIIGASPQLVEMMNIAKNVARTNASVLITGESGTGKELVAEAIHYESERAEKPFVKVNLGGISQSLFESEMFGHKRGAFTDASADRTGRFKLADTGTIFLDEIGDLAHPSQVKLLRVLQEQTFEVLGSSKTERIDVRVVSATNKPLEQMVTQGLFREDLYYRINLITLHIPPLRERTGDIPLLVKYFVKKLATIYGKENLRVDRLALDYLSKQPFPGNIRQLKNVVERTVLMSQKKVLEVKDFQRHLRSGGSSDTSVQALPKVGDLTLEEMEKQMIQKALTFHNYQISETARSLGITRSSLYRRLEKYNIQI